MATLVDRAGKPVARAYIGPDDAAYIVGVKNKPKGRFIGGWWFEDPPEETDANEQKEERISRGKM